MSLFCQLGLVLLLNRQRRRDNRRLVSYLKVQGSACWSRKVSTCLCFCLCVCVCVCEQEEESDYVDGKVTHRLTVMPKANLTVTCLVMNDLGSDSKNTKVSSCKYHTHTHTHTHTHSHSHTHAQTLPHSLTHTHTHSPLQCAAHRACHGLHSAITQHTIFGMLLYLCLVWCRNNIISGK